MPTAIWPQRASLQAVTTGPVSPPPGGPSQPRHWAKRQASRRLRPRAMCWSAMPVILTPQVLCLGPMVLPQLQCWAMSRLAMPGRFKQHRYMGMSTVFVDIPLVVTWCLKTMVTLLPTAKQAAPLACMAIRCTAIPQCPTLAVFMRLRMMGWPMPSSRPAWR